MKDFSYITSSSPAFIENVYRDFVKNPESIDPELRKFFEGFDFAISHPGSVNGTDKVSGAGVPAKKAPVDIDWMMEIRAYRLILGYRNKGHLIAKTNPIRERKDRGANIDISFYGFTEADLDTDFYAGQLIGLGTTSLRNILSHLQKCYASHVGIEFKYISNQTKVDWLTREIERDMLNPLTLEKKKRILEKLNQGVMFEEFLQKK